MNDRRSLVWKGAEMSGAQHGKPAPGVPVAAEEEIAHVSEKKRHGILAANGRKEALVMIMRGNKRAGATCP